LVVDNVDSRNYAIEVGCDFDSDRGVCSAEIAGHALKVDAAVGSRRNAQRPGIHGREGWLDGAGVLNRPDYDDPEIVCGTITAPEAREAV
jgi:hypothetical protein